ncbi:MAG: hybrid sensor histidine kinase/response regulator [Candidatus Omnitrophica bacterium]|nr:hybrid sensor histidine kinase/response regulator [Candidatus Omnitrophota bacterium]
MPAILIVDDSEVECALLKGILHKSFSAYEVLIAHHGREGLELLAQRDVDIVLSDMMMPVMNGWEFCEIIKKDPRTKDVPVLLFSSLEQVQEKAKGFEAGAADYIVKPIESGEVIARIKVHLGLKHYQDQLKDLNRELKEAQDALVQSEKMSAVGTLAAGISHEFNNVLAMMKGYIQLSQQKNKLDDVKPALAVMLDLVERGQFLVRSMLDFSKGGMSENKQKIVLAQIIDKVRVLMEPMFKAQGVQVELQGKSSCELQGYPNQLSQAIINFAKNGIEACEGRTEKKITIEFGKSLFDRVECAYIRVIDTGAGIPESIRKCIFDPFVTTKGVIAGGNRSTAGTGLGLTVSYNIIKKHHGEVKIEKTGSAGTTMLVTIPL